jgi:peptide/nickel transport system permease protein
LLVVVASVTAPLWEPFPPSQQDFSAVLTTPTAAHWLGTDELGRDILSRLLSAGSDALAISAVSALVPLLIAVPLALWAAAAGRRVETVINRVTEGVMALPSVIIVLALVGVIGTNLLLVMSIFGVLISAGLYRVFLGQAKSLQASQYVEAAQVDGSSRMEASARHVLPGLTTTITVQFALLFAIGLLVQAGLAFIGFGPPIPAPSWGGMIQTASQHVYDAPWLMVPSGLMLVITVLSANAVGDLIARGPDVPTLQIAPRRSDHHRVPGGPTKDAPNATLVEDDGVGLVVSDLSIAMNDGTILVSDVSIMLRPGSVLGLVGESGCGKTLTALSLLGLLPAGVSRRSGSIVWNGVSLSGLSERQFGVVRGRKIALISQEPMRALDPMFTVGYQLRAAVRRLQGCSMQAARVEAFVLLTSVGIVDAPRVLRSYPHQISGGMAQRVAIALALAGRPELLIADEPTTALDVTVQAEILSLLRAVISSRGMSMVIVTHDLGVVADICDDVAVMYAGQVVETGSVATVLEQPEQPYTMALLAADPHAAENVSTRAHLASIPGQVPPPRDWPVGCRFAPRCPFATEACREPVALQARRAADGEVRCVRAKEVAGGSARWASHIADSSHSDSVKEAS